MRISNNQKGMVTTHILGLFLTVATPLSLSLISTSSVIAADVMDLSQSIMFDKQPLSVQLGLVEQHFESEPKVPTIILSNEGSVSTYNLGHALHGLKTTLEAKGNSVFLNELLQHFRSENLTESQETAADMAAKMVYQCFRFTLELVANRTASQNLEAVKLNWDVVSRLWDVTSKSLAYQNIFKKLLVDQAAKVDEETSNYNVESAKWDEDSAIEESRLNQVHQVTIDSFDRKKSKTEKTLEELSKSFGEIKDPTPSQTQEYLASKKIHDDIIKDLIQKIEVEKSQFAKAKKEREGVLNQKKKENELAIEQLKEKHNVARQDFVNDFSFIFEDLGGSAGWKTISRVWHRMPTNREGYDYARLDKELLASPELLKDAKSLLLSKISAVSKNTKFAVLEFSELDILEALLVRLNATGNTTISISQDVSLDDGSATASDVVETSSAVLVTPIVEVRENPKGTILGAPTSTLVSTDGGLKQQIVQNAIQQLGLASTDAQMIDVIPVSGGDAISAQSSNAAAGKIPTSTTKQPIEYKKKAERKKKK